MIGRSKRGISRVSMRARLAVAAAVLVGGGAAGVVAVSANHGNTTTAATSAGYTIPSGQMPWSQGMSWVMNNWNRSQQQSLIVITKTVTVQTVASTTFHHKTLVSQRGTVIAKAPWEFVIKSSNGNFNLWHFNGGTKFLNIGGNKTGWNAMSGGMMSSYGSWNWSNMSNSKWNMRTKTLPKGALVFVFGLKQHGVLHAQLVLFAAPMTVTPTVTPTATPTMPMAPTATPTMPGVQVTPAVTATASAFSGTNS